MAELAEIRLSGPENKNGKLLRGCSNISVCLEQELKIHIPKHIDNSMACQHWQSLTHRLMSLHKYIHLQAHLCINVWPGSE